MLLEQQGSSRENWSWTGSLVHFYTQGTRSGIAVLRVTCWLDEACILGGGRVRQIPPPYGVRGKTDYTVPVIVTMRGGKDNKGLVFPVVVYQCESWTIKKAEHRRIDAFKLWCWERLLRVPWTVRRSNQSILKEINPEYSLEGLMLKLMLLYFGHLIRRADSLEKTLILGNVVTQGWKGLEMQEWKNQTLIVLPSPHCNYYWNSIICLPSYPIGRRYLPYSSPTQYMCLIQSANDPQDPIPLLVPWV